MLRYGAFSDEVLAKLRWMNGVLAPALGGALDLLGGIDLRTLIAEALHMGDEGHNRNKAGSLLFLKLLAPAIARMPMRRRRSSNSWATTRSRCSTR